MFDRVTYYVSLATEQSYGPYAIPHVAKRKVGGNPVATPPF